MQTAYHVHRAFWVDIKLPKRGNQSLRTVDQVFVYRQPIHGQLVDRVPVLMDYLHLLDDGGLSTLS